MFPRDTWWDNMTHTDTHSFAMTHSSSAFIPIHLCFLHIELSMSDITTHKQEHDLGASTFFSDLNRRNYCLISERSNIQYWFQGILWAVCPELVLFTSSLTFWWEYSWGFEQTLYSATVIIVSRRGVTCNSAAMISGQKMLRNPTRCRKMFAQVGY